MDSDTQTFPTTGLHAPPPGPDVQPAVDVGPNGTGAAPAPAGPSPLAPPSPFAAGSIPKPYQDESAAYAQKAAADQAAWQKQQEEWQPIADKLRKELSAGVPAPPEQQQVAPPPKMDPQKYQQQSLAFVGAMAALGALSSRFTRQGGTAALNAFAGAVKGWQQGNLEAYKQKSDEWEAQTKQVLANNKIILDKYKAILENKSLNIDQMMAASKLVATEFQDKIAYDALTANNYTMFAQLYDKGAAAQDKAVGSFLKLSGDKFTQTQENEAKAKQLETPEGQQWINSLDPANRLKIQGFVKAYGTGAPIAAATPQDEKNHTNPQWLASPTGQAWVATQPPDQQQEYKAFVEQYGKPDPASQSVDQVASMIAEGRMAALSGYALRSPWGQAVMAKVQELNPNYSATEFTGAQAGARTEATRAANLDIILNSTKAAIPQALAASDAVPRGKWVPVNQAIQRYQAGESDPALAAFAVANLQLVELWARSMNPTGVMRASDREIAMHNLSTATSPEAYRTVVNQVLQAINREKGAVATTEAERGSRTSGPPAGGVIKYDAEGNRVQ